MTEQLGKHGATTVFVSYAHESADFRERVRQLCDWLRAQGVAVVCDFDHAVKPPSKGWATWMQHGVEDAGVVLVVASPKYKARFEKRADPDSGKGVAWEGAIITQDLYDVAQRNDKFFPILPDGGSHDDVPKALSPWNNGHWFPSGQAGIFELIRECQNSAHPEPTPAASKKRNQSKTTVKASTSKSPTPIPLPGDAERLKHARVAIQAYLGCDELKAIAPLDYIDSLPKAISDALPAAAAQSTRKDIAENCMQAILTVAKTYAAHIEGLTESQPSPADKRKRKDVRTRLINAMQTAILLSARQEKMLNGGSTAACDVSTPCQIDVGSVLAAFVQLRVGNLASQLDAELQKGRPPVWKDAGHLRGFDVVEMGTVEKNGGVSGAQIEFYKVIYHHLYPAETKFPDFANDSNAVDGLLSEVRRLKLDGEHLLIILEGQGKTISSVLFKWMIEDTHIGVVTITTKQGVFEVSEGTWTALLVRLFEALKPFEK